MIGVCGRGTGRLGEIGRHGWTWIYGHDAVLDQALRPGHPRPTSAPAS
jgi:hypothetical protein